LTRDDVGGLCYLLSTNNVKFETLLPDVQSVGTSSFVNGAWRPGVDKITFQRMDFVSTNQQVFPTITNQYVDTYITNGAVQQQTLQRVISQPDILFTAKYIGLDNVSRSGTTNWVNNGAPTNDGPGVIQPPVVINLNHLGPNLYNNSPVYPSSSMSTNGYAMWGTYDGTTNPPVVYPSNPANLNSTEFHIVFFISFSQPVFSLWSLQGQPNALFSLQTSSNLTDWVNISTITNAGGCFSYYDEVSTNTPQRFFRTVPQ